MSFAALFKPFISFRFSILLGLIMAFWLYASQSETQPLYSFLISSQIYLIAFLIILGFRLIIWVFIEKGALYNIKNMLINIVVDYITCILILLNTVGCLFLINTFIL